MENLLPNVYYYLAVSTLMFSIGIVGVLSRRNAIVIFMCVELMLNAVNLMLVTFSKYWSLQSGTEASAGSILVFFVMCVAAAEAAVGLAIIIALFRNKLDIDINNFNLFKW